MPLSVIGGASAPPMLLLNNTLRACLDRLSDLCLHDYLLHTLPPHHPAPSGLVAALYRHACWVGYYTPDICSWILHAFHLSTPTLFYFVVGRPTRINSAASVLLAASPWRALPRHPCWWLLPTCIVRAHSSAFVWYPADSLPAWPCNLTHTQHHPAPTGWLPFTYRHAESVTTRLIFIAVGSCMLSPTLFN